MPARPDRQTPGASLESAIWSLASAQHGVIARAQLREAGIAAHVIDRLLKAGRLRRLHRGVYLVGPLRGRHTAEMAAVLACGGAVVVSHRSAGVLWEVLSTGGLAFVEVSTFRVGEQRAAPGVPSDAPQRGWRTPGSRPAIRVHRVLTLRVEDVTVPPSR